MLTTRDFLGATDFDQYYPDDGHFIRGQPGLGKVEDFKPNLMTGIVGMIRFGTGRSAELYLVLGELLEAQADRRHNGLHLAYRAYQRAIELGHPRAAAIRAHLHAAFDD